MYIQDIIYVCYVCLYNPITEVEDTPTEVASVIPPSTTTIIVFVILGVVVVIFCVLLVAICCCCCCCCCYGNHGTRGKRESYYPDIG